MMKTWLPLVIGILLCADVGAEHYDVYVLAGQSNMDGRGVAAELTEDQRVPVEDAIIYYRNELATNERWEPLTTGFSIPPKHRSGLPSPTFGPEIGFARAMLESGRDASGSVPKLAIIKGSKGGTNLRKDWNPGVHGDPKSQGPQYRDMIETISLAKAALKQRGDTMALKGLLWHQGESDSKSTGELHRKRLSQLVTRFREDVQVDDLPVVVGQVFDNGRRDGVREAIEAVGRGGNRIGFVSAEGLTTWDEGTHFDANSQLEMGLRFAVQVLSIQNLETRDAEVVSSRPRVVCFGDSITNRGYPAILGEMLNVESINAGVGGNSTGDAMRRLKKDVLDRHPDVTVLFFGTNDARVDNVKKHVPIAKYRENLRAMINACRKVGSDVIVCTLPPIDSDAYFTRHDRNVFEETGGLAKLVRDYQLAAREVAVASEVPVVDLQELLKKDPKWMSHDGVHPSPEGNRIIAEHIAKAVRPLLPSQSTQESPSE